MILQRFPQGDIQGLPEYDRHFGPHFRMTGCHGAHCSGNVRPSMQQTKKALSPGERKLQMR